jgi:hypothetical protein
MNPAFQLSIPKAITSNHKIYGCPYLHILYWDFPLDILSITSKYILTANMRVLYHTCASPILMYTAPVWFREDKRQKTLVRLLDTTQNKALKYICGTFKTTPCFTLQILGHIPPIIHLLCRLSEAAAL